MWKSCFVFLALIRLHKDVFADVVTVTVGQTAHLPCRVDHKKSMTQPYVIEWLREKESLPIYIKIGKYPPQINSYFKERTSLKPGSATLRIRRVKITDEGWYECKVVFFEDVGFEEGEVSKMQNGTWTHLIVTAPPVIKSSPPPTVTAREKESLLLRCRIVGKPQPDITWRKEGMLIGNGKDGIRINGGELAIRSLTTSHRGNYKCLGRNYQGQVEHTTAVYVEAPPELQTLPKNLTVKEGQDAYFSCKATGFPLPIVYRWFYNEKPIGQVLALHGRHTTEHDGTLVIAEPTKDDQAQISCQAENSNGPSRKATSFLVVQYPPRAINMPSAVYGGLLLSATIPCLSDAVPPASTVRWRKNHQVLKTEQSDRIHVNKDGSLRIDKVRFNDEGRYTCTPYNILGTSGESRVVQFETREPPRFTLQPQTQFEVEIGNTLEANCMGYGDPQPTISWRKAEPGDDEIPNERVFWEIGNITFTSIMKKDHGLWQCVVSNAVSVITSDVMINVKYTTPHHVTNLTVITSYNAATVSWLHGYNGGYPQHFMIWYKRASDGDHKWQTRAFDASHKMAIIERLDPETVYQFSILSENILGSGSFSKTITVKTKTLPVETRQPRPIAVPSPHEVNYVYDDEEELLMLSWRPPNVADLEDFLGYLVEFRNAVTSTQEQRSRSSSVSKGRQGFSRAKRNTVSAKLKRDMGMNTLIKVSRLSKRSPRDRKEWRELGSYLINTTTCRVPPHKIFRDEIYEFRVVVVTPTAYGAPSESVIVNTSGMMGYPVSATATMSHATAGTFYGAIFGVIAVFVLVVLAAAVCYCRRKENKGMHRNVVLKEELVGSYISTSQMSDSNSLKKSSPRTKTDDLTLDVSFSTCRPEEDTVVSNKNGVIRKIKTKFEKTNRDSDAQKLLLQKNGMVKWSRAPSPIDIDPISRSSDGKFRVSTNSHHASLDRHNRRNRIPKHYAESDSEEIRRSCMKRRVHERKSRPLSDSFVHQDPEESGGQSQYGSPKIPENGILERDEENAPRLEIDCSQSDIEVRYVRHDIKDSYGSHRNLSLQRRKLSGTPSFRHHIETDERSQLRQAPSVTESLPRRMPSYERQAKNEDHLQPICPSAEYVYLKDIGLPCPETPVYESGCLSPIIDPSPNQASSPNDINHYIAHSSSHGGRRFSSPEHVVQQPLNTSSSHISVKPSGGWRRRGSSPEISIKSNLPGGYSSFNVTRGDHSWGSSLDRHRKYSLTLPVVQEGACISSINEEEGSRRNSTLSPQHPAEQVNNNNNSHMPIIKRARKFNTHSYSLPSLSHKKSRQKPDVVVSKRTSSSSRRSASEEVLLMSDTESDRRCSFTSGSTSTVRRLPSIESILSDVGSARNIGVSILPKVHKRGKSGFSSKVQSPVSEISNSSFTPPLHPTERGGAGSTSGYDSHCTSSDTSCEPGFRGFEYGDFAHHQYHCLNESNSLTVYHDGHVHSTSRNEFCDHRSNNCGLGLNVSGGRCSNASSNESRSRKDTSSVDDKYEWDSESAMESEILEALKNFESHKRDGPVSKDLIHELRKLSADQGSLESQQSPILNETRFANFNPGGIRVHENLANYENVPPPSVRNDYDLKKERVERRCAALKEEYLEYQRRHRIENDEHLSYDSSC